VWKLPAEGGETVQITRGGGVDAEEAEDGRFAYFLKAISPNDTIGHQPHHVWKVPIDGGLETPVFEETVYPGAVVYWKDQILFWRREPEGRRSLHLFDPESGAVRHFLDLDPGIWCVGLDISPDGRWILFSRGPTASSDLFLVENW
jgi:hypothetical protein